MANIGLIILVFGFVFACLAARGIGGPVWSLGWLAVACLILSMGAVVGMKKGPIYAPTPIENASDFHGRQ